MIPLSPDQRAALRSELPPEQPGPLVARHVLNSGCGAAWADRWPAPRALLWETAGNYALWGDPSTFDPAALRRSLKGYVDAPAAWAHSLRAAFPDMVEWPRVIYRLDSAEALPPAAAAGATVRRLETDDLPHLQGLSGESRWVYRTWGDPAALLAAERAWGAFVDGRLVSVACTFFLGDRYEEIGVATEPWARRRGLNTAAAAGLCRDIFARGRLSSWSTSDDNTASRRVAEKLGFRFVRQDVLYVCGIKTPG